jgi:ankyrin repeat protein
MGKRSELNAVGLAVFNGDLVAVQRAIAQGDDVNTRDRDGRSPLFQSVVDGNLAIAVELIKNGANVNALDKYLESPLHFAARENQVELASLLLKHGARVDVQDSQGNTPLFRAVFSSRGRGEMIRLLLAHSADKTLKNKHGVSPEELAGTIANFDVARFLQ